MPTDNRTNIKNFGAIGDGVADDTASIQKAVNFCIKYPALASTLRIPIGNYRITKPILLDNKGQFFTIKIIGDLNNKSASDPYLSRITCDFKEGYAFGIQLGRSIEIENITILGKYQFPYSVTNANIGTLKFQDWGDAATAEGITDSRNNPYAAIVIDPLPTGGGTSDVTIKNCAFKQFMVGICLSPTDSVNDEMINIIETDIEACRVAIAIGQDQSKTINIRGLKVWASLHTVLDGITYGRGTGGGSVFCENWNIAGNVNQLFNIITDRFPLSCKDIYSESLFRIGYIGSGCGANFINTQIDFLSGSGMPEADYLIAGQANFYGGMLRYYDNDITHRMNLSNLGSCFRDMVFNTVPFIANLFGGELPGPEPIFDNINLYYYAGGGGKKLKEPYDTTIPFRCNIIFNNNWTANITRLDDPLPEMNIGDYILGAPGSSHRQYYDPYCNPLNATTIQIGQVLNIVNDVVILDRVGLNAPASGYDAIYLSKLNPQL